MALRLRTVNTSITATLQRSIVRPTASRSNTNNNKPEFRIQSLLRRSLALGPSRAIMSSPAGRTYEWLVVIPDFPGVLQKRLEVRPAHFAGLKAFLDAGRYQMGGAILEEVPVDDEPSSLKMSGSTIIVVADSKEEILETLRNDVYAKEGVWDVDNAQMWPLKCAFRIPVKA